MDTTNKLFFTLYDPIFIVILFDFFMRVYFIPAPIITQVKHEFEASK
jgi:hypothetical protein